MQHPQGVPPTREPEKTPPAKTVVKKRVRRSRATVNEVFVVTKGPPPPMKIFLHEDDAKLAANMAADLFEDYNVEVTEVKVWKR